jgi:hypothetical protein
VAGREETCIEPAERVPDQDVWRRHVGLGEQLVELVDDLLGGHDGRLGRTEVALANSGPVVGARARLPSGRGLDARPPGVRIVQARVEHYDRTAGAFALDVEAPAAEIRLLAPLRSCVPADPPHPAARPATRSASRNNPDKRSAAILDPGRTIALGVGGAAD